MVKPNPAQTFRKAKSELKYSEDRTAGRTQDIGSITPVGQFGGWKIVPNAYPGDLVFDAHDLLVMPKSSPMDLDIEDFRNAFFLAAQRQQMLYWNPPALQSQPHVFHFHLASFYPTRQRYYDADKVDEAIRKFIDQRFGVEGEAAERMVETITEGAEV